LVPNLYKYAEKTSYVFHVRKNELPTLNLTT
jgi:hypothetical protein